MKKFVYVHKNSFLKLIPFLVSLMIILLGCYDAKDYSGDGQLIDRGEKAATDRYELKLGMINLNQKTTKYYRISNLPKLNFVVGFRIINTGDESATLISKFINPIVSLRLEDTHGNIVFHKESRLNTWSWAIPSDKTEAFVYGRGEPGTYFNPSPKAQYTLTFDVVDPYEGNDYSIELLAKSSGWK